MSQVFGVSDTFNYCSGPEDVILVLDVQIYETFMYTIYNSAYCSLLCQVVHDILFQYVDESDKLVYAPDVKLLKSATNCIKGFLSWHKLPSG